MSDAVYVPRRAPGAQTVCVRGLRLHVTRWGGDGVPALVFLHGFLDTGETFQWLVDALRADVPIAAPDWRGFGRSDWAGNAYWFPDYLADLDQLLAMLVPEGPVTLVGHSMGGNVATLYAGVRPERVRAVVSLEGFGLPRTRPGQAPGRYREWLDEEHAPRAQRIYPSHEQFVAEFQRRHPHLGAADARWLCRAATRPVDGGVVFNADPAHRRVNPVLYRREEAEACWAACRAPVLMLLGGRSRFRESLGEDASPDYFRRHFPCIEVETLEGAGHALHQDSAAACAALIEDFLARHGASNAP